MNRNEFFWVFYFFTLIFIPKAVYFSYVLVPTVNGRGFDVGECWSWSMRVWFLSNFLVVVLFCCCIYVILKGTGVLLETEYMRLGSVLFYLFLLYFIRFLGGGFLVLVA